MAASGELTIVQFVAELGGPDRERLCAAYDLQLDDFLPDLGYLERLPPATIVDLRNDFLVSAITPHGPQHKIADAVSAGQPGPYSATLAEDADPAAVSAAITALGGHDVAVADDREIDGGLVVSFDLDPTLAARAADIADVVWLDVVGEIVTTNVGAAGTIQGGSPTTFPLWSQGLHGEGQVIGVIDNGPPNLNHCFFADAANPTPGPGHRKVLAVRDRGGVVDPAQNGHASFVAGIAAGDELGNSGSNPRRGGAWAARLVCGNHNDIGTTNSMLSELVRAKAAGATIHNNSWFNATVSAGTRATYSQMARDVDLYSFLNEDHLVLGSTGNTVDNKQGAPGIAKNALCVGAAQAHPNTTNLGSGTPGPTADGRRKPDLMTVGCGIESAIDGTPCDAGPFRLPNPCATSWAVPHAAAAAALVRQYFMEGFYPSGTKDSGPPVTPTGALLRAVLINATVDMTGIADYPSSTEGWGLLKLDRTLPLGTGSGSQPHLRAWDVPHEVGPSFVDIRRHDFDVAAGASQLKATLVWTDPAPRGALGRNPTINHLDLIVTAPDGTRFAGNDFTAGVSTRNGNAGNDLVNTVQMVVVENPAAGKWALEVSAVVRAGVFVGVGRSQPRQGYALVVSTPPSP